MSAKTVADIDHMSDTELYNALKSYGLDVGPIVATTRGIYKKKLIEKIKTQPSTTSPIPGLNSSIRDKAFHNDFLSHEIEKSSRNSSERPDSSNRYGDVNVNRNTADRKSFSRYSTTSTAYDDQEDDDVELEDEVAARYERHSPSELSQSYSSYSRQSYEPSTVGLGQTRASDYGRSIGDRLNSDYSDTHTGTLDGNFRSSLGGLGSTTVGSSYRSSLGETASERADRILEDIRRRSTLSTGYKPLSETDRLSRTRDILEQARHSGRVSKSQTYGTQSVLSEYLLKIVIGLVLFVCLYFIITSMTQPNSLNAIDQEVNEILKDSEKVVIE